MAQIAAMSSTYTFPALSDIFEEGETCSGLWVLVDGRVRLYHAAADGRQQVVSFRAPSAPLELGSALDGRPYGSTATALEDSTLVFLPRPVLSQLGRLYPPTVKNVIDLLCLEIRQRDIATAIAALKDARGRIGCALLQLAQQFGVPQADGGMRIAYRLTRQDVADRAGVTIETAIRVLSDLQRQGVVKTRAQIIEITDVKRLQNPTRCSECQFDCSVFVDPSTLTVEPCAD